MFTVPVDLMIALLFQRLDLLFADLHVYGCGALTSGHCNEPGSNSNMQFRHFDTRACNKSGVTNWTKRIVA